MTLVSKGLQMYAANQAGKSAANANTVSQAANEANQQMAFYQNMLQSLMAAGNAGFANFATYLSEGEYKPGQLNSMSDEALLRVADKYGVSPSYRTEYDTVLKKRGGISGFFGGTKVRKKAKQVLNREELIAQLEPEAVKPFEERMGRDAIAAYDAFGTPEEMQARAEAIKQEYDPTVQAGGQVVKDLFSGQMLQDQLSELEAVEQAELNQLAGVQDAFDTERANQMNQMRASNLANYGSANTGLGQRRLDAQMKLATAERMANRTGALNVGQESRRLGLKDAIRNIKLQNPSLGTQTAQMASNFSVFPQSQVGQQQLMRSGILSPHKIRGYQGPTATALTNIRPDTSAAGQGGLMANLMKGAYKQTGGMKDITDGLKNIFPGQKEDIYQDFYSGVS